MNPIIDLSSLRPAEARLGKAIGKTGFYLLMACGSLLLLAGIGLAVSQNLRYLFLLAAPALCCFLSAIWWRRELSVLPSKGAELSGRLSVDVLSRLKPGIAITPRDLWAALSDHWQARFLMNHLLLNNQLISARLSVAEADASRSLQLAEHLADQSGNSIIELGFVCAGLLLTSDEIQQMIVQLKGQKGDIEALANWLGRNLQDGGRAKQNFGGIGRDWAFGFTPLLSRFGYNLSLGIAKHGAHFGWLTESDGVLAIEKAFHNHTGAVALVGPDGIGKTTSAYALAQRLIEGKGGRELAYHQVVTINATDIVSRARRPGDLEQIMISLANEASHAGHIILFLDNAQLFFGEGPGSFDAGQILLSIIEARAIPMILAFTPNDYQRLRGRNPSLANLLTPVMLKELPEDGVMRVLEDYTVGLESRHHVLIAYEALHEAYRLSGRYDQDEAYPGKAIKLLEQSVAHANQSIVEASSVQQAVEQTYGVKASSAAPAEADQLLHLEDDIHKRMINQTHAVGVVANALRRARAGVTNPKRPIGSFLFLGPTGVGKTELAKSVAATYFGSESSMIRLDMSEYQQPDDVQRLLSAGQNDNNNVLLAVRQQPFSVVLLDEIEKAHPNILNLLLQLLDEGQLTDSSGRPASFKDAVIIATSNAGANTIRDRVGKGESLESFAGQFTDELITSGQFKPELINRFDELVLFRPLNPDELAQVVKLMMGDTNKTLASQNISVELTDAAVQKIVATGNDPRLGARPMRRTLQKAVEDTVAQKILRGEAKAGDHIALDAPDLAI